MSSRDSASSEITPEVLLRAYACGIFPMSESATDPTIFWVEPEQRGVIPLDTFGISSRLARTVRSGVFRVTVNTAFKQTIAGCAEPAPGRDETWINARIRDLYPTARRGPHKYTDGAYLVVLPFAPADTIHRYVFETDGSVVTLYRAGLYPPVEYVEGCA